ncbi:hypothetical protein FKG94_07955 [Exilibacterium tricleocarpae]|uniref:Peptidase C39-like domain-containing protein n=1 Tax=Exilibacterium tricleocarpae TaxID=2591008 RepID=A0A545TZK6_9GAMM|nr:papain-like cysteine protease family protein [Exilibacterium tricleocarpae]TQV82652.1 hypothetical protein FKG94_07955 [Exilibacterium tricleocarpae]
MALEKGYNVRYRWQGISLHCWLTSLEMLMDWRYGNIYGYKRKQHTEQVLQAKARVAPDQDPHIFGKWFKAGYGHDLINDYGLRHLPGYGVTNDIKTWEENLHNYGPLLASGNFGLGRIIGGHCILVVGISRTNKLVYLDPFWIGKKAIKGNHYSYMTAAEGLDRLSEQFGVQELYAAESGASDLGLKPISSAS